MTSREQDAVIDRVAEEYGGTLIKPLGESLGIRTALVAVCGWDTSGPLLAGEDDACGKRLGPWIIVAVDGRETVLLDTPEGEE